MSNGDNKSECLRYPGQPDTHTRDELIEYFEELAAKAAPKPTLGFFTRRENRVGSDILTTIKAEVERQSMYANTEDESDSDTSCDAAHWLQKAVDEIERLRGTV